MILGDNMKKILLIIFTVIFILCGCGSDNTVSEKEKVQINLPTDNTVNGYRNETSDNNDMPDTISGIAVDVSESTSTNVESSNKNTSIDNSQNDDKNISYIGNKNSKKFHKSTCGVLKNTKEENKVNLGSKQDFLDQGYVACKLCKP